MYEHEPWEITDTGESGRAHGKITLVSNGWSGEIVGSDENRHFQFDVTGEGSYAGDHYNILATGGYVFGAYGQVIGISLEHMGVITEATSNQQTVQFLGMDDNGNLIFVPAWGAMQGDTELTVTHAQVWIESIKINDNEYTGMTISNITMPYVYAGIRTLCDGDWYAVDCEITIETDLPIFATDAELLAWTQDPTNPELIATMLNAPDDPEQAAEEAYIASQRYYYLRNKFKVSTNGETYTATINNINIKPYGKGRICLYKTKHTQVGSGGSWYSYYLKGTGTYDYEYKTAPWNSFRWDDDDTDLSESAVLNRVNSVGYIKRSASYKSAGIYFVVEYADTNIPIYGSEELADQYVAKEIDIDQAENYDEILQEEQKHILPPWGDEDTEADNGTNNQDYGVGARMFQVDAQNLEGFFEAIYDPANLNDILDNNGLFGQNQMNCIQSVMYLPVLADKFATTGNWENIKLGGWDSNIGGRVIRQNDKMWTVGSTYIAPVFNDFRDLEPYQQLFISLPFCGLHALSLSKYMGHTLSVKYACDLATGSCTAHIYSDGVEYDAFDGNMASFRPITSIDQQSQFSAMMQSVTKLIEPTIDLVAGGGDVVGGLATGNVGTALSGGLQGAVAVPKMAFSAIEAKNAFNQKPTTFKGGFLGALGLFGNRKCHLIVAQKNTVRATNELATIGYPSGFGGFVASFSGYLQCSSFKMAEGFAGTAEEAAEITAMMAEGVYL